MASTPTAIAALETIFRSLPDGSSAAELDALLDEVEQGLPCTAPAGSCSQRPPARPSPS
ncbi:MAG: hypothetical protein JOZ49_20210 [Mycolicibacterium sp.]|nr:hypothetical protein [Mycolicibacterium sp.]